MIFVVMLLVGLAVAVALAVLPRKLGARRRSTPSPVGGGGKRPARRVSARRLGYRYADELVFVCGGSVWTGLVLPDRTDEYASRAEAESDAEVTARLDRDLIHTMGESAVDCQDLVRYRRSKSGGWLTELMDAVWEPTAMFETMARRAGELADYAAPQRVRYRLVRLGDWTGRPVADPLTELTAGMTGVVDERFDSRDLAPFWGLARGLRAGLAHHGVQPMTRGDLLWAIRKTFCGHLEPAEMHVVPSRPWGRGFFDLLGGFRGHNHGSYVELTRRNPDSGELESSYVATLVVVSKPPRELFSPRMGYARRLANLDCTVELVDRYRLVAAQAWKASAKKMIGNILDEAEDRGKAGAGYDRAFEDKHTRALALRDELSDTDMPARVGRQRFVVAAPTPAALTASIRDVTRVLQGGEWAVVAPDEAQYLLLEEALPGEAPDVHLGGLSTSRGGGGLGLWERTSDIYGPAVGGIASYNEVGDRVEISRGRALGWVGQPVGWMRTTGAVVSFAPHAQVARNRGAGVGIFGASGYGKSTMAMTMAFGESESGVQVVIVDMKNDFERHLLYLAFGDQVVAPGFADAARAGTLGTVGSPFQPVNRRVWDDTEIVNLATGQAGLLDPWRITDTFAAGELLAREQLKTLLAEKDERDCVFDGLNALRRDHQRAESAGRDFPVGLGLLVGYVAAERDKLAAEASAGDRPQRLELALYERVVAQLELYAEAPFSRLLFGDGTAGDVAIAELRRRRTILTMHGFRPPDESPDRWGDGARAAAAAVHAALTRIYDLLTPDEVPHPRTGAMQVPPRSIYVDEAKMFLALPDGRALLSKGLRQGRSLNLSVVIITQQAQDLLDLESAARDGNDADTNQVGTVFCFANRSLSEATSALAVLRETSAMSPGERNGLARQLLADSEGGTLRNGVCVMRDCDGRVGSLVVDPIFDELVRAAQTNATLAGTDRAVPMPADVEAWTVNTATLAEVRRDLAAAADEELGVDPALDDLRYAEATYGSTAAVPPAPVAGAHEQVGGGPEPVSAAAGRQEGS